MIQKLIEKVGVLVVITWLLVVEGAAIGSIVESDGTVAIVMYFEGNETGSK